MESCRRKDWAGLRQPGILHTARFPALVGTEPFKLLFGVRIDQSRVRCVCHRSACLRIRGNASLRVGSNGCRVGPHSCCRRHAGCRIGHGSHRTVIGSCIRGNPAMRNVARACVGSNPTMRSNTDIGHHARVAGTRRGPYTTHSSPALREADAGQQTQEHSTNKYLLHTFTSILALRSQASEGAQRSRMGIQTDTQRLRCNTWAISLCHWKHWGCRFMAFSRRRKLLPAVSNGVIACAGNR
jgi:hypothetical protein